MATKTRRLADLLAFIDDDSAITTGGITADTLVAGDIAAGAIGASELATNAVTTVKIADSTGSSDGITAAKLATDAVTSVKIATGAVVADGIAANAVTAAKLASGTVFNPDLSSPHIIPGKLYPAVAGKLLDGSTSHSGSYGTAQADTFSYYYTDIKGSKPIKDPRIGAHFGSHRHAFRSIQKLEQETASHGLDVNSIDGREWIRAVGAWTVYNNTQGTFLRTTATGTAAYIEVTGYFSDINWHMQTDTGADQLVIVLDGGSTQTTDLALSSDSPLQSRYVSAGSVVNLTFNGGNPTLGIHTFKIYPPASFHIYTSGIELIAHSLFTDATCDTTNTDATVTHDANTKMVAGMSVTGTGIAAGTTIASVTSTTAFELSANATATNANQTLTFGVADLSIPAQNVVSYGKKFTVAAAAHHYDPFNGFVNGTTLHSAVVDTATSLGLELGTGSPVANQFGATWAITSSNHIRPYNGGRVVKWVASDGTIKTSVNMMPPNAQNVLGTVVGTTEVTTPSATNATYTPIFSDDAVDHSLAEVAKTFNWREFGNGAANGGAGATWADASMLYANDVIAYVMDDGLTSLSANDAWADSPASLPDLRHDDQANEHSFYTFIGTGISWASSAVTVANITIAQNLPYGTHVLKVDRSGSNEIFIIDGITITTSLGTQASTKEVTFHQPKMPPIPEDAVVLADYMLMADFVPQTAAGVDKISKGVRKQSSSRDCFFNESDDHAFSLQTTTIGMEVELSGAADSATSATMRIPSFGTNYVQRGFQSDTQVKLYVDTTDNDSSATKDNTGTYGSYAHLTSDLTLGVYKFGANLVLGQRGYTEGFDIATPIHTSSHYQTFESQFLHELVGGDRNMEQTNLVVTPDGKSWDEVTRDVSYIGNQSAFLGRTGGAITSSSTQIIFDEARGLATGTKNDFWCKNDWVLAYDELLCLRDGEYTFHCHFHGNSGSDPLIELLKNGTAMSEAWHTNSAETLHMVSMIQKFKRGDVFIARVRYINGTQAYRTFLGIVRNSK